MMNMFMMVDQTKQHTHKLFEVMSVYHHTAGPTSRLH